MSGRTGKRQARQPAKIAPKKPKVTSFDYTQQWKELVDTARAIASGGRGILASDEWPELMENRFKPIGVENTEENRIAYRDVLYHTEGLESYISGAILCDETFWQSSAKNGQPFRDLLQSRGIFVGITLDKNVPDMQKLPGSAGEEYCQGLDDLPQRCAKYYENGARFAKWRATFKIGENTPSSHAIQFNTRLHAHYALICQHCGLVPVVEPEVMLSGDHSIETCQKITEKVMAATVSALLDAGVMLEGILIKTNMVTPGSKFPQKATPLDIAVRTVQALRRTLPPAVPGVMFLSGGLSEEEATLPLAAMNHEVGECKPWYLSFSFGRALQDSCRAAWKGKKENISKAQAVFLERCKANSEASLP